MRKSAGYSSKERMRVRYSIMNASMGIIENIVCYTKIYKF